MIVASFAAPMFATNCWVIAPKADGEGIIIDPGMSADGQMDLSSEVAELLAENRIKPVAVIATHGHLDHIFSIQAVADGYGIPSYIHSADRELFTHPERAISPAFAATLEGIHFIEPSDVRELRSGQVLDLLGMNITAIHAPGHTKGSMIFTVNDELLISGDVLFAGSIGRTDLPGGSSAEMEQTLQKKILPLSDHLRVLPGHGPETTMAQERKSNPIFAETWISAMKFQAPKGVSEYVPPESEIFAWVRAKFISVIESNGYELIELPVFEDTELFTRIGASTDVVSKEMYTFEDRGGRSITLRPEGTVGALRAIVEHGLDRAALPVKVYYSGAYFRAERPQAGRYRQFYSVGAEAIGSEDPALDAEMIAMAHNSFKSLGLKNYTLHITSLGDSASRAAHRVDLLKHIASLNLDEATKERSALNPLRLFDDKRDDVRSQMLDAPKLLDYLSSESAKHFAQVQELLTALDVSFEINPRMVRGLDYYTGTTFEFVHHQLGAQSGIGGGGRYDGLMKEIGGQDISGIGFGLGVDRTILAMAAEGISAQVHQSDLFLIPLGDESKAKVLQLAAQLRGEGLSVEVAYGDKSLKAAMKQADKSGARFSAVVGESELSAQSVEVKEMATGASTSVTLASLSKFFLE